MNVAHRLSNRVRTYKTTILHKHLNRSGIQGNEIADSLAESSSSSRSLSLLLQSSCLIFVRRLEPTLIKCCLNQPPPPQFRRLVQVHFFLDTDPCSGFITSNSVEKQSLPPHILELALTHHLPTLIIYLIITLIFTFSVSLKKLAIFLTCPFIVLLLSLRFSLLLLTLITSLLILMPLFLHD